jgi:transposase
LKKLKVKPTFLFLKRKRLTTDLRQYTALARGQKVWKIIFKRFTAVKHVKVHFDLVTLVYTASKLATDRINALLNQQQVA